MALQSSGAISLNDIAGEFGGSAPHSLNEYYGVATGIPGSGTIALSMFYGTSSIILPYNELKVIPSDSANGADDYFGGTVAVGNNVVVISCSNDDDRGANAGAAYIFNTSGGGQIKLTASDGVAGDIFGTGVAVGSSRVVAGARDKSGGGAAYIYDLNGGNQIKITASDRVSGDEYGAEVGVGNNVIAIGAPNHASSGISSSGAVYLYNLSGGNEVKITADSPTNGAEFGSAIAIGQDSSHQLIVVGAYRRDKAYVYNLSGTLQFILEAHDINVQGPGDSMFYGQSVAIGGGCIAIGAYRDNNRTGAVYLYDLSGTLITKITADDAATQRDFGNTVALGDDKLIVGSSLDGTNGGLFAGSVYTFDLSGNQLQKMYPSDGGANWLYGSSVALGSGKVIVGSPGGNGALGWGAAYFYDIT